MDNFYFFQRKSGFSTVTRILQVATHSSLPRAVPGYLAIRKNPAIMQVVAFCKRLWIILARGWLYEKNIVSMYFNDFIFGIFSIWIYHEKSLRTNSYYRFFAKRTFITYYWHLIRLYIQPKIWSNRVSMCCSNKFCNQPYITALDIFGKYFNM